MDLMDAIRRRRSIRAFTAAPIPENVLAQILEAGRLAPSAMNAQNWHFGIITDQAVKDRLVAVSGGQEWVATAPLIIALCTELSDDIRDLPEDELAVKVYQARYGRKLIDHLNAFDDRRPVRMLLDWHNVIYAGQQMVLAAESYGISACYIGLIDTPLADDALGLPENIICELLLPMGYPAEEPEPIDRKTIDEITFRDRWG
jgi:nitroreductase